MATKTFFIIKNNSDISDGIIQTLDKENIGNVWKHEAPIGHFFKAKMNKHYIISEEDYKLLNKYKKNEKILTNNRPNKG